MRRLFSTFARGWPGVGLLLLRVAAGGSLVARSILVLSSNTCTLGTGFFQFLVAASGLLLIAGLWTPVVAALTVLIELWRIISRSGDPASEILLCTVAIAIALLGPGAWSIDAHLFGWKRIEIDTQKSKH